MQSSMFRFFASTRFLTFVVVIALVGKTTMLAGCAPQLDKNGNIPLAEVVEAIEAGKHSREKVATMLGSPSTQAGFEKDQIWYYIGKRQESLAFFRPKILEHQVLEIRFDGEGIVKSIKRHDARKAEQIDLVERITPTKGNELTFIEQLIGNLGRFNPAPASNSGDTLGSP